MTGGEPETFRDLDLGERTLIVRRGTDYCMRYVAELSDDELNAPSLLDGWTRRHLIAHLAYNAAALGRLLDSAATGIATPMYESRTQRADEIEGGAELEATALRNLLAAETARLDDKWRRLPQRAWSTPVRTLEGKTVPASETLWMRTREVWIHAVDLGNGATFSAMPAVIQTTLLTDIVNGWRANGASVDAAHTPTGQVSVSIRENPTEDVFCVSGSVPSLLQWMTGRGTSGLSPQDPPPPPRWL